MSTSPPWYRQFWPWFLMAPPLLAVLGGAVTAWLAIREPASLVVDDYARIGLATNQKLERDRRAAALGVVAQLSIESHSGAVTVRLLGDEPLAPRSLELLLAHPTLARRDRVVELAGRERVFQGVTAAVPAGRWYVQLEPPDRSWRLAGVWSPATGILTLRAPREGGNSG